MAGVNTHLSLKQAEQYALRRAKPVVKYLGRLS
jgi:hypothetical protein